MDLNWKLNKTEHIVQDEWIDFRKESFILPDGKEFSPFYNYSRRNFVVIIARTKDDKYITVRQFRHGLKKVTTEFCAGGIEGSEHESALLAAKRELEEETGYVSNDWKHIYTIPSNPTIADNYAYLYYADNCEKVSNQHLDSTEFIEVKEYTEDEIKAMNDVETVEALNGMWSNFCVTDAYEPGSVVKPIVMASALEKGAIQETDTFVCDGSQTFGDTMIKCAVYPSAHGTETLGEVIANSCNDAMMQIGAKMGATQFIKAQSLFNFGTRTGIDLPNEGAGIIHTKDSMGETELACSAFGQGFTCTMIQEINAMSSVINGGYYYQPHLVTKVLDSNGGTVKTISPILLKQTISSRISSDIRSYMALSVQQGTSRHSKVQGYSSGGKTGTAEKYPRGNGKYLVSFIGFAPVDDPAVVIYVVVDEPNVEDQANSTYPQYIAQGILSELLPYLNVVPDESEDGTVPETELWEGFKGHLKSTSISDSELDSDGNLVDADGNLIDWDGNRIDENGYLLDANGDHILDEEGNYKMSTNLVSASGSTDADSSGDAVSNPDAPAPLEDDEAETTEDNDEETDGITNEEAGLE